MSLVVHEGNSTKEDNIVLGNGKYCPQNGVGSDGALVPAPQGTRLCLLFLLVEKSSLDGGTSLGAAVRRCLGWAAVFGETAHSGRTLAKLVNSSSLALTGLV